MESYETKKENLLTRMRGYDQPLIACSAGADSALLTELAFMLHPKTALAVFVATEALDEAEQSYALAEANLHGWRLLQLTVATFGENAVFHNRRDRCYHCKKLIYTTLRRYGILHDYKYFIEGSNADDSGVFRPGARAIVETGFISPLAEADFTKANVRRFGAELQLNSARKPSAPCLLTRFPYDLENGVKEADIERIKIGEHHLKRYLTDNFRLRFVNTNTARIETAAADQFFLQTHFHEIIQGIPFDHVILDEAPFQSGSFDRKAGNGQ